MGKNQSDIEILISGTVQYLKQLHRSGSTISHYSQKWRQVKLFMEKSALTVYDKAVEVLFLRSILGDYDYRELSHRDKSFVNIVRHLLLFQETGHISPSGHPKRSLEEKYPLKGESGNFIKNYVEHLVQEYSLSESSSTAFYFYLSQFNSFLTGKQISSIQNLTTVVIQDYIGQLYPFHIASKYSAIKVLKRFLTDMYRQGQTQIDLSLVIGTVNYRKQEHLPSTLSVEETERLLLSVDRASGKGKRDYAILMIAVHLGLRSSDIVNLRFENINWEKSMITIQQQKTGKTVELPLLPAVGNAIIDYLKYGRPQSEDRHLFLKALSPYKNMSSHDILNLLQPYLTRAGINCKNRKHGPNILRHSLAGRLLDTGTPLPVISETLGHSSSQTTMFYLRIDASRLRECALDVPQVSPVFYRKQGGGYEQ